MSTPTTIFIGGSRSIRRLDSASTDRLSRIMATGYRIVIGDANGVDSEVQSILAAASYERVTIFCSGIQPRNRRGAWPIRRISAPSIASGYEFHAIKDRAMADEAVLGFMIWDGISPGTALNSLRLTGQGKSAFIADVRQGITIRLDTIADWTVFIAHYPSSFQTALRSRATPAEWAMTGRS